MIIATAINGLIAASIPTITQSGRLQIITTSITAVGNMEPLKDESGKIISFILLAATGRIICLIQKSAVSEMIVKGPVQ